MKTGERPHVAPRALPRILPEVLSDLWGEWLSAESIVETMHCAIQGKRRAELSGLAKCPLPRVLASNHLPLRAIASRVYPCSQTLMAVYLPSIIGSEPSSQPTPIVPCRTTVSGTQSFSHGSGNVPCMFSWGPRIPRALGLWGTPKDSGENR